MTVSRSIFRYYIQWSLNHLLLYFPLNTVGSIDLLPAENSWWHTVNSTSWRFCLVNENYLTGKNNCPHFSFQGHLLKWIFKRNMQWYSKLSWLDQNNNSLRYWKCPQFFYFIGGETIILWIYMFSLLQDDKIWWQEGVLKFQPSFPKGKCAWSRWRRGLKLVC